MKYLKTYRGNVKMVENKVNLLYKSEIFNIIDIMDLKLSMEKNEAIAAVALNIKNVDNFIDCSHIEVIKLENYKRSRILYFEIEDGREFKLVMSNRMLFARTTGFYYNNIKVGNLTFKNTVSIANLKNIVVDFLNITGILISITELKEILIEGKKDINGSVKSFVY